MFKSKLPRINASRFAPLILLCASTLGWAQAGLGNVPPQANGIGIRTPPGLSLTPQERQVVVAALLANSTVSERTRGHKIRAIRVTHGFDQTVAGGMKQDEYRATVVLFDYTTGKATRYGLDPESGELVSEEPVRGRPQASEEEIELATRIVRQDPTLSKLLAPSGRISGGFVVDGPPGKPATHRYLQMRLVTHDLRQTIRVAIVDLTDETVAASN